MNEVRTIYIAQGEQAVSASPEVQISTILGSCVAVCLWDPVRRQGGMNHMLLANAQVSQNGRILVGAGAMERLINALIKVGSTRGDLRAKIFGGSSMLAGMTNIGERNVEFARSYLQAERIVLEVENVGGTNARQVKYTPTDGRAQIRLVPGSISQETEAKVPANGVELFD